MPTATSDNDTHTAAAGSSPASPQTPRVPLPFAVFSGLMMGAADAVPGVSGGTIALILGIYRRFIAALSTMVRAPWLWRDGAEGRARVTGALGLLIPLGLGLGTGLFVTTKLLVGKEDNPGILRVDETAPFAYAFFFGLVLCSLREPWRRIRAVHAGSWAAAAVGAVTAFVVTGLPYAQQEPPLWLLPIGGALAITVMLLPGVSGSLLLLTIGQYTVVTGAVHDRNFVILGLFAGGVLFGLATFVPLLRRLLRSQHDLTMAALTGLMAGSLRALWPWKSNYDKEEPMLNVGIETDSLLLVVVFALIGGAVVLGLAWIERLLGGAEDTTSPT